MKILLVEDNKGDQVILQEAFEEAKVECDLSIVGDGEEAIQFLKKTGKFKEAQRPNLIILDLNLPKKSGLEVLSEIKRDPEIENIPVIVLSNSTAKKDICSAYALNASVYVGKPAGFQRFVDFARMIKVFWGELAHYCAC